MQTYAFEQVPFIPIGQNRALVDYLLGDPGKAERQLNWKASTYWAELATLMVDADVALVQDQLAGRLVRADR